MVNPPILGENHRERRHPNTPPLDSAAVRAAQHDGRKLHGFGRFMDEYLCLCIIYIYTHIYANLAKREMERYVNIGIDTIDIYTCSFDKALLGRPVFNGRPRDGLNELGTQSSWG